MLESAYQTCLAYELRKRGLSVRQQVPIALVYDGISLGIGYRIDLLVEEVVVVETKATRVHHPIYEAQLLSHLRLSGKQLGLLINFHVARLVDGIKRMVNQLDESS